MFSRFDLLVLQWVCVVCVDATKVCEQCVCVNACHNCVCAHARLCMRCAFGRHKGVCAWVRACVLCVVCRVLYVCVLCVTATKATPDLSRLQAIVDKQALFGNTTISLGIYHVRLRAWYNLNPDPTLTNRNTLIISNRSLGSCI